MNHIVVVDASVAFKVVIEEEFSDRARTLFTTALRSGRILAGLPHLAGEVINAIYQRLRRGNITEAEAEQALREFTVIPIQFLVPSGLYYRGFNFARANGLTAIYDSLYVVLAEVLEAELWTDDRRLINSLGEAAPWVRWIGDYGTT